MQCALRVPHTQQHPVLGDAREHVPGSDKQCGPPQVEQRHRADGERREDVAEEIDALDGGAYFCKIFNRSFSLNIKYGIMDP